MGWNWCRQAFLDLRLPRWLIELGCLATTGAFERDQLPASQPPPLEAT